MILMDEMTVQENLVWDKNISELIAYIDLGGIKLNYATLSEANELASHIWVFLVCSIVNLFKVNLASFSTKDVQAAQLFRLFIFHLFYFVCTTISSQLFCLFVFWGCWYQWIEFFEGYSCYMWWCSSNRKLCKMNFKLTTRADKNSDVDITYHMCNLHSFKENWFFYFIQMCHIY